MSAAMPEKCVRKLIEVEITKGFLNVPPCAQSNLPQESKSVPVRLGVDSPSKKLRYNATHKRFFGLTKWYRSNGLRVGQMLNISVADGHVTIIPTSQRQSDDVETAKAIVNLSGLSSASKGNIVEDRIKELLLLYGQGLLNVYRPVIDNEGIDLIVLRNGVFHPIFLQVKSRFDVKERGNFIIDVSSSTFQPHHSFFIVGASFDPVNMEIEDNILVIKSLDLEEMANRVNNGKKLRVVSSLQDNSKNKWAPFMVKKQHLVEKLLEKFAEMDQYYS